VQAVTHLALGAAVAVVLAPGPAVGSRERRLRFGAAIAAAALSHALLDDLALATYHPPEALPGDPFWLGFHTLVFLAIAPVVWRFRRHGWVMAAALTPDLDWVLGRALGLWEPGALHGAFRALPGISAASEALRASVPDLRLVPAAAVVELGPVAALLALAHWAEKPRAEAAQEGGGPPPGPPARQEAPACADPTP
jgi:hypothetical protein